VHLADFTLSVEDHFFKESVLVFGQLVLLNKNPVVAKHHEGLFALESQSQEQVSQLRDDF